MSVLQAIFLGLLQGLTEFLPVSSSGHLVLVQHLMGVRDKGDLAPPVFELVLHFGTLLAVVIYFHKELIRLGGSLFERSQQRGRQMIFKLGLAMVPAVGAALLFGDFFKAAYQNPTLTSFFLVATGLLLLLPRLLRRPGVEGTEVGWRQALWMGIGQAFAILPGISRSGATIVAGMLSGVRPGRAAEFSFLLAIPAITGALVYERDAFGAVSMAELTPYIAGFVASFFSGLLAVYLVLSTIRKGKFEYFGYYCILAGLVGVLHFSFSSS